MIRKADGARISVSVELLEKFRLGRRDRECARWAEEAATRIDSAPHGIIIPLGSVCPDDAAATVTARAVAEEIVDAFKHRWSLHALRPEYGAMQTTTVGRDKRTRTLLPHHDGGNSSFLTPSRLDLPDWVPEDRRTFPPRVTTTRAHKLYQGFLVQRVGESESITPYYDLLTLLMLAFRHQVGSARPDLISLQNWCADNLRYALGLLREWGGGYVQLGTLLGSRNAKHILVNLHNLDDGFSEAEKAAFPDIESDESSASHPAMRLFDDMILETTGLRWPDACVAAEQCLETRQYDLVFGHNILLMHGGINGGSTRLLAPICAVVEEPSEQAYEHWLADAWRTAYRRATSALPEIAS